MTMEKIALGAVDSSRLADGAVTSKHLGDETVDGFHIKQETISGYHLIPGTISLLHLEPKLQTLLNGLSVREGKRETKGLADKKPAAEIRPEEERLAPNPAENKAEAPAKESNEKSEKAHTKEPASEGTEKPKSDKIYLHAIDIETENDKENTILDDKNERQHPLFFPAPERKLLTTSQQFGLSSFSFSSETESAAIPVIFDRPYADDNYVLVGTTSHPGCYAVIQSKQDSGAVIEVVRCNVSGEFQGVVNWIAIGSVYE